VKTAFQGSLLDASDETALGPLGATVRRAHLARGAWVDIRPGWLTGADALFERVATAVPWRAERRMMYDRGRRAAAGVLLRRGQALPDPVLTAARDALSEHYRPELGEPLCTAGCACTGTGGTAWPGTATRSGVAAPRTPW
jgi:hypothetical protein